MSLVNTMLPRPALSPLVHDIRVDATKAKYGSPNNPIHVQQPQQRGACYAYNDLPPHLVSNRFKLSPLEPYIKKGAIKEHASFDKAQNANRGNRATVPQLSPTDVKREPLTSPKRHIDPLQRHLASPVRNSVSPTARTPFHIETQEKQVKQNPVNVSLSPKVPQAEKKVINISNIKGVPRERFSVLMDQLSPYEKKPNALEMNGFPKITNDYYGCGSFISPPDDGRNIIDCASDVIARGGVPTWLQLRIGQDRQVQAERNQKTIQELYNALSGVNGCRVVSSRIVYDTHSFNNNFTGIYQPAIRAF